MPDGFARFPAPDITVRRRATGTGLTRTAFVIGLGLASLAGFALTDGATTARAIAAGGEDLTRLLRAMALLKAAMAVGAASAIVWRLQAPISPAWHAAYGIAAATMMAGPGLIWGLDHVGLGAALLHGGLVAVAVLLWRDPAVSARLAALVASRRRSHAGG